jgi:hypothetical protein
MTATATTERTGTPECPVATLEPPPPAAEAPEPPADANPGGGDGAEAPEAESLRRIAAQERRVAQARREYEAAREQAKKKKNAWDEALDELCEMIREESEPMPLFDGPAAAEPVPAAPAEDESWREVPLGDVLAGLPPSLVTALYDADLASVGQLSDFLADGKKRITDIPGIGPVKAEKVEKALEEFWARTRAAAEPPPGEDELDRAAAPDDEDEDEDDDE